MNQDSTAGVGGLGLGLLIAGVILFFVVGIPAGLVIAGIGYLMALSAQRTIRGG